MASACFLESSLSSARLAARCFNVTVGAVILPGVVVISPSYEAVAWKSAAHGEAVKRFGSG
jgi:hypothetical protein